MKRFVYRLQLLLDRTTQLEEELQRQLEFLRVEKSAKEREITAKIAAQHAMRSFIAEKQKGCFNAWEQADYHLRLGAIGDQVAGLRRESDEIARRIAVQLANLTETMRKRQTLEKLKEKQHEMYRQEEARSELRTMEEAVLPRMARAQAVARAEALSQNGSFTCSLT